MDLIREQKQICQKYNAAFAENPDDYIVGISLSVRDNISQ